MAAYRALYDKLEASFDGCEVRHVGRESNEEADTLANIGSKCLPIPPGVFYEEIFERSIKMAPIQPTLATRSGAADGSAAAEKQKDPEEAKPAGQIAQIFTAEPIWTKPYLKYLISSEKPEDIIHCRQVIRRSKSFTIINGELYR